MTKNIVFLFCIAGSANADDSFSNWSVRGFGTLGVAGTDTQGLGFYRDFSQSQKTTKSWSLSTDSRLGIQVDVDINESLHGSLQWVARDHIGDFFEQNLEWAFLRWSLPTNTTLRLGRLGVDAFLLSDSRNIGYSYPWMRPPHEFYAMVPVYHFDGMDITQKITAAEGTLSFKLFAGYSFNQVQFDSKTPVVGTNIRYELNNWQFRLGYSFQYFASDIANQPLLEAINNPYMNLLMPNVNQLAPHLSLKDSNIHFYSLGGAYDDGTWLAQAEAAYIDTHTAIVPDLASAYVSIGRRFSNLTVYSLLGIAESFHKNISIPAPLAPVPAAQQLQEILDHTLNYNGVNQKSVSLGLRWDFYANMAFKVQWSHFFLGSGDNGSFLWQTPSSGDLPKQVNLWSVGIDFVF